MERDGLQHCDSGENRKYNMISKSWYVQHHQHHSLKHGKPLFKYVGSIWVLTKYGQMWKKSPANHHGKPLHAPPPFGQCLYGNTTFQNGASLIDRETPGTLFPPWYQIQGWRSHRAGLLLSFFGSSQASHSLPKSGGHHFEWCFTFDHFYCKHNELSHLHILVGFCLFGDIFLFSQLLCGVLNKLNGGLTTEIGLFGSLTGPIKDFHPGGKLLLRHMSIGMSGNLPCTQHQ